MDAPVCRLCSKKHYGVCSVSPSELKEKVVTKRNVSLPSTVEQNYIDQITALNARIADLEKGNCPVCEERRRRRNETQKKYRQNLKKREFDDD